MRVAAGISLFLFLSGLSGLAQTAPTAGNQPTLHPDAASFTCESTTEPGKPPTTVCKTPLAPVCPIDMRVHQGVGGGMVAVDKDGVKRHVFAQRLRLFLNELRPADSGRRMVSATVTVQGSNGKARMQPLDGDSGVNAANVKRTISVDLQNWGEPGVSGDIRLPGFTSAGMVYLQSITYDDGSTWKVSARETCRVAPDPLMLIGQ